MKKILPALLLFLSGASIAQAQVLPSFEIGLKGALNYSKLKNDTYFDSDSKAGYQAGLYSRIGVLGFHVQPEIYITGKNVKINKDNVDDLKFTSVDIPVLLGKRFGLGPIGARIQTGPVFSFITNDNGDKLTNALKFSEYKKSSTSWAFGAGVDISSLRVDLRYELGLNDMAKGSNEAQKINMWSIGLGYRLFKI
ncbi:opacity protein-like surface antigen [Sphingobacterium yanglingense]|uniref:Opacity protein-like surface antigen n=2 Tax=Sphingobacterium yanglingense TaxID=1437280 RepID=A0A4R6WTW9_9SPHI|nr:opacity protein-like surface antigen [Sphingobacterium yanglingense]